MSTQGNFTVGKAKISIDVDGCVICGTLYSSGWTVERTVEVQIGKRRAVLAIHICADCLAKRNAQTTQLALDELATGKEQ